MREGKESRRNDKFGLTHVNHFYTKRNLLVLAALFDQAKDFRLKIIIQSIHPVRTSKLVRYLFGKGGNGILSGTLYFPSFPVENNVFDRLRSKISDFIAALTMTRNFDGAIVSCQSMVDMRNVPDSCIDYIFTDPPFGGNLMY